VVVLLGQGVDGGETRYERVLPTCSGVVHIEAVKLYLFLAAETARLHRGVYTIVWNTRWKVFKALQHLAGVAIAGEAYIAKVVLDKEIGFHIGLLRGVIM
jgi:hypothetical protein